VKESHQTIITRANDREFFPLVNHPFKRFLLYTLVWIGGTTLMVGPAWALASFIISK